MGFQFQADPTFRALVEIPAAGDAPAQTLTLVFRHQRRRALAEWIASLGERSADEALAEVIAGWLDEREFTAEALAELYEEYPGAPRAILRAYVAESAGAERKN